MLNRRTLLATGAAALTPIASLTLGTPAFAQARRKDTLVIGLTLEPTGLDPTAKAGAEIAEVVHYNVFETLTKIHSDGSVTPLLAEGWEVSPDLRTVTFRLRRGVKFQNGEPFNAQSVKFSFDRAAAADSTNKDKRTFAQRPRWHMHFVPTYSSWLNQVERFFAIITDKAIRRSSFTSVKELINKIDSFVSRYNENCKPFTWTATADSILQKLARLCGRITGTGHYVDTTGINAYDIEKARRLLAEAGVKTPLELSLVLPPPAYARQGGEFIAAQLAKIGIVAKIQNVEWAQWISGTYGNKNYDLSLILHVEPFDLVNYTKPEYYWGYQSPKFNAIFDRIRNAPTTAERNRQLGEAQRLLAEDAANVYLFQPQFITVAPRNLRGLWKDTPIFVNDIAALSWA